MGEEVELRSRCDNYGDYEMGEEVGLRSRCDNYGDYEIGEEVGLRGGCDNYGDHEMGEEDRGRFTVTGEGGLLTSCGHHGTGQCLSRRGFCAHGGEESLCSSCSNSDSVYTGLDGGRCHSV
jgi:hypothetical protein